MSRAIAIGFNVLGRIGEILNINDTALSDESKEIHKESERSAEHYLDPISRQEADHATKFYNLKTQWEAETVMLSSITEIAMNPAYQQIIGMGLVVIPLILTDMREKPGHWFWALKSITGKDPVLPEQRGRIKEMTKAWLNWGKEQGYIL